MSYPLQRLRRLRKTPVLRDLVAENSLNLQDLVYPVFVIPGKNLRRPIQALPGVFHFSADRLVEEAKHLCDLGLQAILIFGVPARKDPFARGAYAADGIVPAAVRVLKKALPRLVVITDVCLCEYTDHGHCGIIRNGYLDNDASLKILARVALSHARAGADVVAPAAMLDGQVHAIRSALDSAGHADTVIMSYSAKFASKLYDPFFKSVQSVVAFGDKRTHQMDFRNSDEALREIALDIEEGADIVMVKPALFYLDVVQRAKSRFQMPLAVYNVSGEYAMLKAAAQLGKINELEVVIEALTACKRAGADLIITYFAKDLARHLSRAKNPGLA